MSLVETLGTSWLAFWG